MSSTPIKLFLDENIWSGLTTVLKARGYDVLHVFDVNRRGLSDESQFQFAAEQGRAILTYNTQDFVPIYELWYETGHDHAGLIVSDEIPHGELARRVTKLLETVSAEEMKNMLRYLQEFK